MTTNSKAIYEAISNAIIGFIVGVALNILVLPPLLGIEYHAMSFELAIIISLIYGGASVIRSFILRKAFSKYVKKGWRLW